MAHLIHDPPRPGGWNMAADQTLLEEAAAGSIWLRVYAWSEPTLSLGYFQPLQDRRQHAASRECALVRRSSGGGAILHHHETTYALTIPHASRWSKEADHLYSRVHEGWIAAFARQGIHLHRHAAVDTSPRPNGKPPSGDQQEPFLCFQRRAPGDLVQGAAKIVGSAQRRLRGALLQHGSVLWRRSPCAPEVPGIEDLHELPINRTEVVADWLSWLATELGCQWHPQEFPLNLVARVEALVATRFGVDAWTGKR